MREEVEEKIEKWQEPPKGKEKKALPVPDEAPRKKRGGKRYAALMDGIASWRFSCRVRSCALSRGGPDSNLRCSVSVSDQGEEIQGEVRDDRGPKGAEPNVRPPTHQRKRSQALSPPAFSVPFHRPPSYPPLPLCYVTHCRTFGGMESEYGDSSMGKDFGMLGVAGGRLRLPAGVEKKGRTVNLSYPKHICFALSCRTCQRAERASADS